MGFYEQISKYYDYIFPSGKEQVNFISEAAGEPPRRIIDIACGAGGYSLALASMGYNMTAVDIDAEMVRLTNEKAQKSGLDIEVVQSDMKTITNAVKGKFDCVFCIGNSIAHLSSIKEISDALAQMHEMLDEKGTLVVQIINYDRILKHNISGLPTIENVEIGLRFVREYKYSAKTGIIDFNTILTVGQDNRREEYLNTVCLYPVTSGDMMSALEDAGFREVEFYGSFDKAPYNDEAYLLVLRAKA